MFFGHFSHFQMWKSPKNLNQASKMVKIAVFNTLLSQENVILRKIWAAVNFWNFHNVNVEIMGIYSITFFAKVSGIEESNSWAWEIYYHRNIFSWNQFFTKTLLSRNIFQNSLRFIHNNVLPQCGNYGILLPLFFREFSVKSTFY